MDHDGAPPASLRILVVEDEAMVAMMLDDILSELGHRVLGPVHRLPKALELSEKEEIDFALLDVHVAGEEVYAVADRLIARGVPFAFTTGYGRRGLREGYQDQPILQKPFSMKDLSGILTTVILTKKL
jgi:CheY-like chemotaxis protein